MSPVPIVEVDLSEISSPLRLTAPETLVLFWFGDWPVGQKYVSGRAGDDLDVGELARASIDPDLLASVQKAAVSRASQPPSDRYRTSVVICTRDRPDELARCLASFPRQTRRPDQLVVVDNASIDDRTRKVASLAGVDYIREEKPGLDVARNTGALAATGDIIAYTDDDVLLHPRWLERMVAAFDDDKVTAVTGLVLPAELETDAQRHFETLWGFGRGYRRIDFGSEFLNVNRAHGCPAWEIGAGASMAFRREAFERIGLFDERLDVGAAGCSGDSEYWYRILSNGGVCRYEPSAVVYHFHRRDFAGLSRQIFSYMRGHAAALLIQFEQTGHWGNLRRAFVAMPIWYARRLLRRFLRGPIERDRLLPEEIRGLLSGFVYYLRTPRPPARGHT